MKTGPPIAELACMLFLIVAGALVAGEMSYRESAADRLVRPWSAASPETSKRLTDLL